MTSEKSKLKAKDFMSTPVTTAVGETPVHKIRKIMEKKGIHSIPIVKYSKSLPKINVKIRGIITASDIGKKIPDHTPVEKVMTKNVHVIHQNSSFKAAAKMMLRHKVHHLVVMYDGKITGIISSLDFVKIIAGNS